MASIGRRNYEYISKCDQKPFSFRWVVEHLPIRLRSIGRNFLSPDFEAAPGIRLYVYLSRNKLDDQEEWLSTYLYISPSSQVNEAILNGFSITLLRSSPKQDRRFEANELRQLNVAASNNNWGCSKLARFSELTDPAEGFLAGANHLLTVFVEGNIFNEKQTDERKIVLMPDECAAKLEANICKQTIGDYGKMFDGGIHTDFVVKAKDANGVEKELKVHKGVLAARSEVFAGMFSNPELKECHEGQMEIEDAKAEVMEALIRFLYTGTLAFDACKGIELELLVAADKYQIDGLKKLVEHLLTELLSVENVCGLLVNADLLKAPHLTARCVEFIRQRRTEVTQTMGWLQMISPEYAHLVSTLL